MTRVVFMCGPAGSGKSTVARALEAQGMVRLSIDQEAWGRGFRTMPLPDGVEASIASDLRRRLEELVAEERDVVLDFSFWSRRMRDEWRRVLAPWGIVPEVIHLATDREICLRRVAERRTESPDDFTLEPEVAARYFDQFEPPSTDEGPVTVLG